MADLNIPNLNMNSNKYIFKKKLSLRRKSKRKLIVESVFMFIFSLSLVYINYLIPSKNLLLQNLPTTLNKSSILIIELFLNLCEIFLLLFVIISSLTSFILLIGSINRLFKIFKKSSKKIVYK